MKRATSIAAAERPSRVIEVRKSSTTVKIYPIKNRDKTLYMVTWFVGGKRNRRNFMSEGEARKEAGNIALKMSRGEAQITTLKGTDRESFLLARQMLAPLGMPLHDAIRDYVAARKILKEEPLLPAVRFFKEHAHQKLPEKSADEVVREFLKIRTADGASVRYLQDIRSRLGRFAAAFHTGIADVQTVALDEWLRSLKVSARSRKNVRILLVALFNFARASGYLPKNVTTAADGLSVPKVDGGEIEIYSVEDMLTLLQHADQHTLPLLCLGGFAGLRTAEIERLTWEQIKWGQNVIEVGAKTSKTGQRRLVPILAPLRSFLMQFAELRGPVIGHVKIHERLRNLAIRAKVPRKHNALRHSYASYRLAIVKDVAHVALELGNSPRMVFQHYRELVVEAEAKKWWATVSQEAST